MKKGNIILVNFPFTDFKGFKLRPAVIVAVGSYDVTACFITTKVQNAEPMDVLLNPNSFNGIKKQSLIRPLKIMTFEKSMVAGKLGNLTTEEIVELNIKLKAALQL